MSAPTPAVIRVERNTSPFDELSEAERARLIIRVLCELVAYGEPLHAPPGRPRTDRSRADAPAARSAVDPIAAAG